MVELLRSLVEAATPFMQHQANPNHFEFLGLDIIADTVGGVWLLEGEKAFNENRQWGLALWYSVLFWRI